MSLAWQPTEEVRRIERLEYVLPDERCLVVEAFNTSVSVCSVVVFSRPLLEARVAPRVLVDHFSNIAFRWGWTCDSEACISDQILDDGVDDV